MKIIESLNSTISDMHRLFVDGDIWPDGYIEFTEHNFRVCLGGIGRDMTNYSPTMLRILSINSKKTLKNPEDIAAYRLLYTLFKKQYFKPADFSKIVLNQEFTSFCDGKTSLDLFKSTQDFVSVSKEMHANCNPKIFNLFFNEFFTEPQLYPAVWMTDIERFSSIILDLSNQEDTPHDKSKQKLAFEFFSEPSQFIQLLELKDIPHSNSEMFKKTSSSLISHIEKATLKSKFIAEPHAKKHIAL